MLLLVYCTGEICVGEAGGGGGGGGVAEFGSVDYLYVGVPEIEVINQLREMSFEESSFV